MLTLCILFLCRLMISLKNGNSSQKFPNLSRLEPQGSNCSKQINHKRKGEGLKQCSEELNADGERLANGCRVVVVSLAADANEKFGAGNQAKGRRLALGRNVKN